MGRLVEGLWDCPYCDTKGIGGLTQTCPNCGKTRGEETKFYMPSRKHYLTEEEEEKVGRDPDWYCDSCDSLNPSSSNFCKNCGAPRGSKNYFNMRNKEEKEPENDISENITFEPYGYSTPSNEPSELVQNDDYSPTSSVSSSEYKSGSKSDSSSSFIQNVGNFISKNRHIFAGALAGILLFCLFVGILIPKERAGTIEGFRWTRSITIQEYKTVDESDWSVPSGGRLQYTAQEVHHYNSVLDHYETKTRTYTEQVFDHYETSYSYVDNGNGTFEEVAHQTPVYRTETRTETYEEPVYVSVPVYQTKYYYEIERWVFKTNVNTSGDNHEPVWGEYEFAENEREGGRNEKYFIEVNVKDKVKEYTLDYESWHGLSAGDEVKMKVYISGTAVLLEDEIKRAR